MRRLQKTPPKQGLSLGISHPTLRRTTLTQLKLSTILVAVSEPDAYAESARGQRRCIAPLQASQIAQSACGDRAYADSGIEVL